MNETELMGLVKLFHSLRSRGLLHSLLPTLFALYWTHCGEARARRHFQKVSSRTRSLKEQQTTLIWAYLTAEGQPSKA
jgi:Ni,Fe-hydrogenase I cytochrome b subunit